MDHPPSIMERIEQMERELLEKPWYVEWKERREREMAVKVKAFWKEWDEWEEKYESEDLSEQPPEGSLPIANVPFKKKIVDAGICRADGPRPIEYYHRSSRACGGRSFTINYKFVQGVKSVITSKETFCCRSDKCFDSTWVAVHGMESICMVTRRQDVDMNRVGRFYQRCCTNQQTMFSYAETVTSLVECLPYVDYDYNDDDLRLRYGHMIEKPFSVVSFPDTEKVRKESGHEASSYVYDVRNATMFLCDKMESGLAFTIDETIQTAISAFQRMCRLKELKAEDIWVTTLSFSWGYAMHLNLDQRKEHLAVINGGSSSGDRCSSSGCSGSSAVAPPKCLLSKCDDESDNQPSLDFLASQFSSLSIY